LQGKIRVYARCRPFATYEIEKDCNQCVVFKDDTTCTVDVGVRGKKEFEFDEVFRLDSTQQQIFEGVSHLVQSAVDGYNVCIFAYGQTGSGKTFTMYGKRDEQALWGIAPRCMRDLFEIIARDFDVFEFAVSCYMLELYNDGLVDLLVEKRKKGEAEKEKKKLDVKLDKRGVVVVTGAEVRSCESFEELERWNNFGMDQRHVASTAMNAESSRSHLIFSILVEARNKQTGAASIGKLSLVDLAGSERQSKTHAEGDRLKEAKSINMSLSALGDVISKLAAGDKHVPYRNNKLTQLLQDGLGGNAKTLMFVNISPADYNAEETSTSLQYAQRVKLITNVANKQQESAEVQRLKRIIKALKGGEAVEELEEHEEAEGDVEVEIGGNGEADDSAWMEGPQGDLEAREGQ
jgi:kinesin family protein C2/C3